MMAITFNQDRLRLINLVNSRLGYKISSLIKMQMNEDYLYIPTREQTYEPIKKAFEHTLANPNLDILSQVTDTYQDNVRILGLVYDMHKNVLRLIMSRCAEEHIKNGDIVPMDKIRFMDITLTEDEHFTYTFVTLNTWNFGSLLKIDRLTEIDFYKMLKCSQSSLHGLLQVNVDLNKYKEAKATNNPDVVICQGVCIEEQPFYDLDANGKLTHYQTVRSHEGTEIPAMLLKEFESYASINEPKKAAKIVKMELHV